MLAAERIGERRREEREDLPPAKEHHPGEQDKQQRIFPARQPEHHRYPLQRKGDKHGLLAAEAVGNKPKQRPG